MQFASLEKFVIIREIRVKVLVFIRVHLCPSVVAIAPLPVFSGLFRV
jgi:hypothetical protein